jgi:hypothetical protein
MSTSASLEFSTLLANKPVEQSSTVVLGVVPSDSNYLLLKFASQL